jgi:putative FmdB family regulatory protein
MPTYEYKNIETGEVYEFKQSMRDDAYTQHPETGAAIKRIVSVPGIAFKGSGFYANDSRASASRSGAKSSTDAVSTGTSEGSAPGGEKQASDKSGSDKSTAPSTAPAKAPAAPASKSAE